jgi:pimeloyl-ACP methyl ester carboxylesterase
MIHIHAIHGAFSSPTIFNYIRMQLGSQYQWHFLDYQQETGGLQDIISRARAPTEPHHVVGHSMGGLIALALWYNLNVNSVTTISTPLGGVDVNFMQQYLSRSEFMSDISSSGDFIRGLQRATLTVPVQHIVSTAGFNPWIYEPCDGVVTVRSQRAVALGPVYDVASNHAEVMMDDRTVELLKTFWV